MKLKLFAPALLALAHRLNGSSPEELLVPRSRHDEEGDGGEGEHAKAQGAAQVGGAQARLVRRRLHARVREDGGLAHSCG